MVCRYPLYIGTLQLENHPGVFCVSWKGDIACDNYVLLCVQMQYSVWSVLIVECTLFAINWTYDPTRIDMTYLLLDVWMQRKIYVTGTNILQF